MKHRDGILSVIVPCYNEKQGIQKTITRLQEILLTANIPYEIILVDDGSSDNTFSVISQNSQADPVHIKGVCFSRNFGKEAAMIAGLQHANGDCAVLIDSDLQHPPEIIPQMYELWGEGFEIVEGVKNTRQQESWLYRGFAKVFYGFFSYSLGVDIKNASDYKLLDRRVINVLSNLSERETFLRGLSFWTGYKTTNVVYTVQPRSAGKTKWSFFKLVSYAIRNIISFSSLPLHFITFLSVIMLFLGVVFGVRAFGLYFTNQAAGGITTVVVLILLTGGLILLALGIIGQYIASIYNEIKGRPRYLVETTVGDLSNKSQW